MPKADARECPISFVFRSKGGGLGQETRGDAKLVAALSQGGGFQPGRTTCRTTHTLPRNTKAPIVSRGLIEKSGTGRCPSNTLSITPMATLSSGFIASSDRRRVRDSNPSG
jgi:hypothetical protein